MNKKLLSVACLMGAFSLYAQVGVGTLVPNKSAELAVISSERGLLIPNIALKDLTDAVTIKAGNIESLLVYNTNSTNVLSPGYYYWENNKWNRLLISEDIPQVVIDNFEEISQDVHVTNLIENIIRNTQGNVLYDNDKLYYIDKAKNQTTLLFSNDDFITILDYDLNTGTLTYKNESNNLVSVDIKSAVKAFESITKIVQNLNDNTITFYDEKGDSTTIDLEGFVKNAETVTTLVKDAPGKYTYTNEKDVQTKINLSGDLVDIIHEKLDLDLYNILKTFVKDHQSITRLFYNPTTRILNFTDENEQVYEFDLTQIVQENQEKTRIDANASKNIVVQSNVNGNTLTYTLEVKPATPSSLGVVRPGSGLIVDQDGVLSVDTAVVLQGKDLKGNNKIVVTNGQGSVLKEVELDIDESKLSLQNIGGILNLNQLFKGNKGDILIVDHNGDIVWSALDLLITNSFTLENSSLVSNVNGKSSSVSLVDKISTEMLQSKAVTQDKLGATPAQKTMVGVVQDDGSVKYQKLSKDNIESKLLESANNLLTVTNGGESVLRDVTLTINQANFDLSLIGGKLNITQIKQGDANTVLITNNSGELEWVNKTLISPDIVHNLSSTNNNMTSTINGVDRSATIIANVTHILDGSNLTTSVNGVASNKINLASIDHTSKVLEGTNVQVIEAINGNETSYTVSVADSAIQVAQTTSSVEAGANVTVVPTTTGKNTQYLVSASISDADIQNGQKTSSVKAGTNVTVVPTTTGKNTEYLVSASISDTDIQNGQIVTIVEKGTGVDVGYATSNGGKTHTYTVSVDPTQELLAGDVTGSLGSNTVVALQGIDVLEGTPQDKQVLTYDATTEKWVAKAQSISNVIDGKALTSSDLDLSANASTALLKDVTANIKQGAVTTIKIADDAVTTDKIADAGSNQVLVTDTSGKPSWVDQGSIVTGNQTTSSVKAGTNVTVVPTTTGKNTEYLVNASISDTDIQSGQKTSSVKAGTNVTVVPTTTGKNTEYLVNASISDTDIQSGQKTSSVKAGTNVTVVPTTTGKNTEYLVNASISDTEIQSGQKTSSVKAGTNVTVVPTTTGKNTEYLVNASISDTDIQSGQIVTIVEKGTGVDVGYATSNGGKTHTYTVSVDPAQELLAGDVTGSLGSNTVVGLQGTEVSEEAPAANQVLTYDADLKQWVPKAPSAAPKVSIVNGLNTTVSKEVSATDLNETIYKVNVDVKSALPSFFYMPSVFVPTSSVANLPTGVTFNNTTRKGEIKLYQIFNAQFEGPVAQSDLNAELPTFDADELNYFVTYADPSVFVSVDVSDTGILTYEVSATANVSAGTFMNIVFSIR